MTDWTQETLEQTLLEQGWWLPGNKKPISNGVQYRLTDGTPVSFYPSTGRILVQGKDTPLKRKVEEFLKNGPVGTQAAPDSSTPPFDESPDASAGSKTSNTRAEPRVPKVFIVYGHDDASRRELGDFLRRLKLEPVVLRNLPGGGNTIIENLDSLTDADFACVLLTPDDEGRRRGSSQDLQPRARQNVVLELGMVLAKLGRQRVAILIKEVDGNPIERPTDIEGIIYIPFKEHINESNRLAGRLKEVGFDIQVLDLVD